MIGRSTKWPKLLALWTLAPFHDREDGCRWNPRKDGSFSVKFAYNFLLGREEVDFRWEDTWKIRTPSKVLFFVWTVIKNHIPTLDFLQKRGLILPNMCPLCQEDVETAAHILLHCPYVREVWYSILWEVNIMWAFLDHCPLFFQQ